MKRIFMMTGTVIAMLAFFMVGCHSAKQLQKSAIETAVAGHVEPQQLEAMNGVVNFTYTIQFGQRQFDKNMILKITPKVVYGTNVLKLQPMFLQGEHVKDANYPVVGYDRGGRYSQKMSFNFRDGMQNGVLWADIEAMSGKKTVLMSPVVLNKNGIRVWQQPAFSLNGIDYIPALTETFVDDVPAAEVGVVSGYVMFPLGKSTISEAERHSAVMSQAVKAMDKVLANRDAKITNMFIYVSNSPEGAERLNRNLATNRFRSAKKFFEEDLNLADRPMARNPKFVVQQTVAENWPGLYMLLEASDLRNKEQIIRDLKAAPNANRRNAVLDSYVNKTPELKEVILPVLRRADFFVFYTVPATVQEEVEMTYFVPQLTEKAPAVTAQTNWQLLNDLAVMAIENKQYDKAQRLLESAIALKQDAAVNNNMGVVCAMKGDRTGASRYFDKARLRKEARENMGLVCLRDGNYNKAVSYLKDDPSFYLAYAQLMNNENQAALNTFRKIKMNRALDYYMMAVAAARTKDTREMTTALQKAVQMDPKLKNWAASDISFYPYRNDPVYMQAIR